MRVVQCPRHLPAASHPVSVCPAGSSATTRGLELFCSSYYAVATIRLHLYAVLPLIIADLNYRATSGCFRQP